MTTPADAYKFDYELLERAREGDMDACGQAVEENAGLIWSVARRFFGRGVDPDDLYQLGCVGFLKAVQGYDARYGTQFSTYAVPKIAGEIRRFLRDDGSIKVSRSLKETAGKIRMARRALEQSLGREPTVSELSIELGITAEEIAAAETAVGAPESLQRETGEDGFTLESVLTDSTGEEALVERVALREAIDALPEKERIVIRLRYYRGMTQEGASRVLSVSQVQVSRLERRALGHLRAQLE
ncbi:MAG: sigma-70 family RNA polymerase sigma factor [Oscillospiraceae bacterium]|jgi:RNA polymerase sporulation-specific sigma factor|nr:sigma-70 family RNA polymerase sigma factor [Oscillospiraceae bacterium]